MLSLKGSQSCLQKNVSTYLTSALSPDTVVVSVDGGHGRFEKENGWLKERYTWAGLHGIFAFKATRETDQRVTEETRYFVSSLSANDPQINWKTLSVPRGRLRIIYIGVLILHLMKMSNRTLNGYRAANLAVIRHIALNLIKKEQTSKVGVKTKWLKAGWDNDYSLHAIGGN